MKRPARRLTSRVVAAPAAPAPPPRPHYRPAWVVERRRHDVQHATVSLYELVEDVQAGLFRLPRFQRPFVWTDEQVIRLFDSMTRGYHVGSLLLWEQYGLPRSTEHFGEIAVESTTEHHVALVVDGQQRIVAVATAALSGRFYVDMETGALVTTPGPMRAPAAHFLLRGADFDNFEWVREHAATHGLPYEMVWDAWCASHDPIGYHYLSIVRLGRGWTLEEVVESYRRLNTEGTPMDPGDLAAGLARARVGTDTAL